MRDSKLREKILSAMLCLTVAATAFYLPVTAASGNNSGTQQMFKLRVQFGMTWKERVEINTKISSNIPFTARAVDREGHTYNIGGMLLPRKKGKYRLILTAVNWDELSGDGVSTLVPEMELNKTVTVCSSDGVIHNCIAMTLSSAKNENSE